MRWSSVLVLATVYSWQPARRLALRVRQRPSVFRKSVAVAPAADVPAVVAAPAPRASKAQWAQLRSLVKSDWPLLGAAAVALVAAAAADIAVPHYSSGALTAVVAKDSERVRRQLWGLAGASVASAAFTGIRGGLFWLAGTRVVSRLRLALFGAMLRQDIGFFDATSTGELASRLSGDAAKVSDVVSFNLNIIARQTLQALGGCAYLFALDAPLALLSVAGMALASVLTDAYGKLSRKYSRETSDRLAATADSADEALRNVRVARSCGAEPQLYQEYERKIHDLERVQDRAGLVYGLSRVGLGGCKGLAAVATMALGARRVQSGALAPDAMVRFAFYAAFVNGAAFDVGDQLAKVEEALGAGATAFELARREPAWVGAAPPSALDAVPVQAVGRGAVEFDKVRFAYPSRNASQVLRGVNVRVAPGERVALVGASGSGKSTLTKLLLRQYGASAGCVRLDGVDVRDVPQADLARTIASVEQDPALYAGTIRDNVRFGLSEDDPRATDDRIAQACRAAGVDEFASRLPLGLETPAGSSGALLSGGQKQRVSIARALLRDPAVIVLDEPSSALDARSEALVQRALDQLDCSVLVVAHRLATIKACDRIYVLERGLVVEEGNHAELVALNGTYAGMAERQSFED